MRRFRARDLRSGPPAREGDPPAPADRLLAGSVHVWWIGLCRSEAQVRELASVLSAAEQARCDRLRFSDDRRRFTVTHVALRMILGDYLATPPGQLGFGVEAGGKPYLTAEAGGALQFNLAHSHELAVCAICRGRRVGVDLEYLRPVPEAPAIAARFFAAGEQRVLAELAEAEATQAFFNCWTRKEAFVKATGAGLTFPLERCEVSLAPGEPARLLKVGGSTQAAARWSLMDLQPAVAGYAGALAVEGPVPAVEQWQLDP